MAKAKTIETTIQGKKIVATFSPKPDENILKLVKTILINSHTSSHMGNASEEKTSILLQHHQISC